MAGAQNNTFQNIIQTQGRSNALTGCSFVVNCYFKSHLNTVFSYQNSRICNCKFQNGAGFLSLGVNCLYECDFSNNIQDIYLGTYQGSEVHLYNCSLGSSVEVAYSYGHEQRAYSTNNDRTIGNHWIFTFGGTINAQTTTRHSSAGLAWKLAPSSSKPSVFPLFLNLGRVICFANKQTTVSVWVKKDHATNIVASLMLQSYQIAGCDSDIETIASNSTDWQQISISFTPTEDGVVTVQGRAWYNTGVSYAYFDDISVVVDGKKSIDLRGLDYGYDGPLFANNSFAGRSFVWCS